MIITAPFTSGSAPKTGLSPTIRIRRLDSNSLVITDASMVEVGDGWYKYDFVNYTGTIDYAIRIDGGSSLPVSERYAWAGNENYVDDIWNEPLSFHTGTVVPSGSNVAHETIAGTIGFLKEIENGRWKIDSSTNQMIFYKSDNTTEIARFNLLDATGSGAVQDVFERTRV